VFHRSYQKRKEEKQETTSRTRQEKRHSITRTNDHKIEGSEKLVGTTARTSNNIYVLSEIGNEKCCLGKEDEI
jgi:hypothetical protein